jgi:hypothetical protein
MSCNTMLPKIVNANANTNANCELRMQIGRWLEPCDYRIVRAATYRFLSFIAPKWREGRVLLAGDAAHSTPPFMGQVSQSVWYSIVSSFVSVYTTLY